MPEIDPLILQLRADDAQYKASMKDVVRVNEQATGAILLAANKIDTAADKMIAAFQQMASSDKAAAATIVQAEAAKEQAAAKSAAAAVAAAKLEEQANARNAKAASDAAKAAEKAAKEEEQAHKDAAAAAEKAARDRESAAQAAADAMSESSESIQSSIRAIAASVAAYFTVDQLQNYADGFTRLQNNLRVAGVEGQELKQVQDRLFESAQKYGVEIEGLSNLYGQLTQASKELGASQSDIYGLTDAVSASLKITGISSEEASGALLQLTQALRGGKIQAEEYNSLLDGLYPLLQAAANGSSRFGGSVAKLTALVKDGKVSSDEFMKSILAGSSVLEGQASKATMTLSAGYTTLNNALTIYFGEADKANGVSAAMAEALGLLADNLDTIIPAVAALTVAVGVRYVAGVVAATTATQRWQAAMAAMQTVGLAVIVGAIGAVIARSNDLENTMESLEATSRDADKALQQAGVAADGAAKNVSDVGTNAASSEVKVRSFAGAVGLAAQKLYDLAKARQADLIADIEARRQKASLDYSDLYGQTSQGRRERHEQIGAVPGLSDIGPMLGVMKDDLASWLGFAPGDEQLKGKMGEIKAQLDKYDEALEGARTNLEQFAQSPDGSPAAASDSTKKARSGPTAEEITTRYNDDLSRLKAEQLQAELQVTTDAQKRADLQTELLDIEYKQRLADINASKEYSEERKDALRKELNALFGMDEKGSTVAGPANVYSAVFKDLSDQQKQMAQDALASEREALEAEADLITNRKDRLAAEQAILGIVEQEERQRLELQIANGQILDAAKARAELERRLAARREGLDRQYESPLEQRRREVRQTAANMGDAIEQIDIDAVDRLADGLANASTEYIKLGGIAGDVINGIIQDLVRLAAKQALFGNNGGAGIIGSIGSFLGLGGSSSVGGISAEAQSWLDNYTPKGFASGGYTGDGPRNEVAGVVHRGEYVIPANAVDRIGIQNLAALASGDTSAARAMTGVTAAGMGARPVQQTVVVKVEANDYFDARVDQRATQVAAPIGVAASAQARNAAGSDATRAARRRIPGR
ncbi:hypothetical protein AX777_18250 [Sphingobium yanoikuyae]|uniref:Tape measure protein N-terminal domain-containing protein n=2 Tax=Sphingobium yanoikuyae TaxID=13690 RepID=A0A177J8V8_SPHYA|nr:hypothetical protein AX777_18250 [Sphingobium yanoikuyae]